MHGEDRLNIKMQLIISVLKLAEFPDHISIDYGLCGESICPTFFVQSNQTGMT